MAKIKFKIRITTTPTELAEGIRSTIIDPVLRDIEAFTQAHVPEIIIVAQQLLRAAAVRSGLVVDDGGDSDDSEDDAEDGDVAGDDNKDDQA